MSNAIMSHSFLDDIRSILRFARQKAYASANFIMVEAYWQIGQRIVKEEQSGKERAEYGRFLIHELSRQLGDEFGRGVSIANLWNFRQFYLVFPSVEKLYALRRELTWTHYRLVMRVESAAARDYYIREAAEQGWSTRRLERNIASLYYERLLKTSTAESNFLPSKAVKPNEPETFIKILMCWSSWGCKNPPPRMKASWNRALFLNCNNSSSNWEKAFPL